MASGPGVSLRWPQPKVALEEEEAGCSGGEPGVQGLSAMGGSKSANEVGQHCCAGKDRAWHPEGRGLGAVWIRVAHGGRSPSSAAPESLRGGGSCFVVLPGVCSFVSHLWGLPIRQWEVTARKGPEWAMASVFAEGGGVFSSRGNKVHSRWSAPLMCRGLVTVCFSYVFVPFTFRPSR